MCGSDWLLLSWTVQGCDYMFNVLQVILGSTGYKVLRKTPCLVLVVFVTQLAMIQEHY
jgi:hypothetical protein